MPKRKTNSPDWNRVGKFPPPDLPKDTVELADDVTIVFVLQQFGPYNLEA